MQILLIADDYSTKSKKVGGKMLKELADELVKQGHTVAVIAPNTYDESKYSGDNHVDIYRFNAGEIKNTSKLKRLWSELQFSRKIWKLVKQCDAIKPDLIMYCSPSIFFGKVVTKIKQRFKIKSYLVLRDFFPQWVIDHGMIRKNSAAAMFLRYFERKTYQAADRIGVMSPANLKWFNRYTRGQYHDITEVLYNWVDVNALEHISPNQAFRREYELEDKVVFIYGGNIGYAQQMKNIIDLARRLKAHTRAHFVLIGQGDEFQLVDSLIRRHKLHNVLLLPAVAQEAYFAIQKVADVGLFSLHSGHKTHNFPGKILGYLSQPMPVLGSVNHGNDIMSVINDSSSGFVSEAGDLDQLYHNALELINNENVRDKCCVGAHQLALQLFSVDNAAKQVLRVCS